MSEPTVVPGLPGWLQPLADVVATIGPKDLSPNGFNPPSDARPAAVLMLFAETPTGPELLLTERATTLRHHAGQVSFPGGGSDPEDGEGREGAIVTALREADEEVGLKPSEVLVFGTLPRLWLPPSNFAVTPVLGYWREPRQLHPASPAEVARVVHHPIAELLNPQNRFSVVHPGGWRGPAFDIGTQVPLWGFTAGIVSRLFEAIGWEKPWDETVERDLSGSP